MNNIVVFITCKNKKEANRIAQGLIKEKLAACVNVINKIESIFFWQGKIDKAAEALLIVKTKKKLLSKLIKKVKVLHSYSVPEIIAIPIIGGSLDYLNWINDVTR
ncbi:MAG: divalent-cation tolerance protein CutA [Candidatus Omnitrophota bacterium]